MERLTKNVPAANFKAVPVNIALDFAFELDDDTWLGLQRIFDRLASYEDTGLEPEEVQRLKLGADVERVKLFDGSVTIARLRELAAADKEGRALIVPAEEQTDPYRQMLRDKIGPDALRLLDMLEGRG